MAETYFDTRLGELLVGEAAVSERLEQSSPGDVVPLRDLLVGPDFTYETGTFERLNSRRWTKDDYITAGSWVMRVVNGDPSQEPVGLSGEILDRGNALGLIPSRDAYKHRGFKIGVLSAEIEVPTRLNLSRRGLCDNWTTQDFIEHAQRVSEATGGARPREEDYMAFAQVHTDAPTPRIIRNRMASISKLNEHIGFPNIREWDKEDYIDYGVDIADANDVSSLKHAVVSVLARRRRGPDYETINYTFGSWKIYKELVLERLGARQDQRDEKLANYYVMLGSGTLPWAYASLPQNLLLRQAAAYTLLNTWRTTREWSAETKQIYAGAVGTKKYVSAILAAVPGLSVAQIEIEAEVQGLQDDIWPAKAPGQYLRVQPSELKKWYKKQAQIKRDTRLLYRDVQTGT